MMKKNEKSFITALVMVQAFGEGILMKGRQRRCNDWILENSEWRIGNENISSTILNLLPT